MPTVLWNDVKFLSDFFQTIFLTKANHATYIS